ncbi:MAG: uroporphyrinogen-III C-methyltransferase [Gallionella sp.]
MSKKTSPPEKEQMPKEQMPESTVSEQSASEQPTVQSSQTEKQTPESGKSGGGMLSGFGLTQLMLVVLTVVFAWQWFNGHRTISNMERQLTEKVSDMSASTKASQMLVSQSQGQVRELAAKVTMMETRFGEAKNQRVALETLYNDLSGNRDEAALAAVEQMLLSATQQLQLTANVKAALIALQSSDARLRRMDRGAFGGLRNQVGKDIDKLRALPNLDIPALNLKIDELIVDVDALPLAYLHRVVDEDKQKIAASVGEAGWKVMLVDIWDEFKQLVRMENTENDNLPLLSPDQVFFLRENLKLRLLSARIALLSRDEVSFRQELMTAQRWTAKYFDIKSKQSIRMQSLLQKLAVSSVNIELPDISGSLQIVRNYRQARERAAERQLSQKGAQ